MFRRHFMLVSALLLAGSWSGTAAAQDFTDSAGRTVAIPPAIERVLPAGPPAAVLLYALAPEKMVGWVTEPSPAAKEFIAEPFRDLPVNGRLTGRGNTANLEMVLAMEPDLILDVGSIDDTYASLADRVQEQTGIPYVLVDGRFDRTPDTIREVGALLGVAERAEEMAAFAEAALARLEATIAGLPEDARPRVYYGRGPDGLETGLAGSINMEVLGAVGATNVAEAAGAGGLANVSVEQVLSWNPDVILALDPNFRDTVTSDPVWAEIAAVREGRVYGAPTLPFGWFDAPPGINRVIGVAWLTSVLYPGEATNDLRADVREFFRLFYHVDLDDAQIDRLLAGAVQGS